jgi:hypothetical protein
MLTATASTYSRADSDTLRAGAGRWFEFAYMLTVITLSTLNVVGVAWGRMPFSIAKMDL